MMKFGNNMLIHALEKPDGDGEKIKRTQFSLIDPSDKSDVCTFLLQSGALWDICLMYWGICGTDLLERAEIELALEYGTKYLGQL